MSERRRRHVAIAASSCLQTQRRIIKILSVSVPKGRSALGDHGGAFDLTKNAQEQIVSSNVAMAKACADVLSNARDPLRNVVDTARSADYLCRRSRCAGASEYSTDTATE